MRIGLLEYTETGLALSTWLVLVLLLVDPSMALAQAQRSAVYVALAPGSTIVLVQPKVSLPPLVQKSVTTQIAEWQPRSTKRDKTNDDDWGHLKLFGKAAPKAPSQPDGSQLAAAASQLLNASLRSLLVHRLRLVVVPVQEQSGVSLRAGRTNVLFKSSDVVAVASPAILNVVLNEKSQRRINVWARITIYIRDTTSVTGGVQVHRVYCSGSYAAPRVLLGTAYLKTRTAVLARACWTAASMAVSSLEQPLVSPFARPDATVAIAPTTGPTAADLLVFSNTGRRVLPSGISGLKSNVSDLLNLDLQPILAQHLVSPAMCMRQLMSRNSKLVDLWDGTIPNVKLAISLGKQLHVKLVFLCRIVDLEASTGNDRRDRPADSAYARSVGYLLNTSTGQTLWSGVGAATMHSGVKWVGGSSSLTVVVQDAERFALSALNRKFEMYKNQFVTGRMLKVKGSVDALDG